MVRPWNSRMMMNDLGREDGLVRGLVGQTGYSVDLGTICQLLFWGKVCHWLLI